MKKICILNQGCDVHVMEFRKLINSLEGIYELTNFPGKADLIIQHFCSIAQDKIPETVSELAYLSKVKKENAILIVCGCATKVLGEELFLSLDFVDYVIGREDICENILKILERKSIPGYYLGDNIKSFFFDIVGGCKKKGGWCAFCKQNYMKIPVKSMKMEEILQQTMEVTETKNIYSIVLVGLNICNYGIDIDDKKPKLHLLIKRLAQIPKVKVIDLCSLTVADMYEELIEEIATNDKVRLVELGVQSGCNKMLSIMNTGATKESIQMLLNRLSHKAMKSIIVVGHPGETREDLQETLNFVVNNNLWYMQVSSFISTEGTPSHSMQQLSKEEYEYNVKLAKETVWKLRKDFLDSLVGSTMSAYIVELNVEPEEDIAYISMIAKEHSINFILSVQKFSTSKYITFFEEQEEFNLVKVFIKEIIDYKKAYFEVELVEERDNENDG